MKRSLASRIIATLIFRVAILLSSCAGSTDSQRNVNQSNQDFGFVDPLNEGVPAPIATPVAATIAPQSGVNSPNQVTLIITKAPSPINWESPSTLLTTTAANMKSKQVHPIGHVNVEVFCNGGGSGNYILAGQTDKGSAVAYALSLIRADGLDILFADYNGILEDRASIEADLKVTGQQDRLAKVTFEISKDACENLLAYYKEYQGRGVYKHYGLHFDSGLGEGAGCGSFAASFIHTAGMLAEEMKQNWSSTILVQDSLRKSKVMSGKMLPRVCPRLRGMGLPIVRIKNSYQWGEDGGACTPLRFWSPDQMFAWVNATSIDIKAKTRRIIYDYTDIKVQPKKFFSEPMN